MHLPLGGPTIFVVFPDAIVITSLLQGNDFQDVIPLKRAGRDCIIGSDCEGNWVDTGHFGDLSQQSMVVCTPVGFILVEAHVKEMLASIEATSTR
jgi:hypothetical protein